VLPFEVHFNFFSTFQKFGILATLTTDEFVCQDFAIVEGFGKQMAINLLLVDTQRR